MARFFPQDLRVPKWILPWMYLNSNPNGQLQHQTFGSFLVEEPNFEQGMVEMSFPWKLLIKAMVLGQMAACWLQWRLTKSSSHGLQRLGLEHLSMTSRYRFRLREWFLDCFLWTQWPGWECKGRGLCSQLSTMRIRKVTWWWEMTVDLNVPWAKLLFANGQKTIYCFAFVEFAFSKLSLVAPWKGMQCPGSDPPHGSCSWEMVNSKSTGCRKKKGYPSYKML